MVWFWVPTWHAQIAELSMVTLEAHTRDDSTWIANALLEAAEELRGLQTMFNDARERRGAR